ncbi:MAG: leucine-rich repeat protein [Prevotella sp.]|nr:leucine-rich repeat protein [Prevotella sp.]
MKKILSFFPLCFCSMLVQAQTFFNVDGVRYLIEDDHVVVARQDAELAGDIVIPATVTYGDAEYAVTRMISPFESESGGGGAFQECAITGITLPDAITLLPDHTFQGCTNLSSVKLPVNIIKIDSYAFQGCSSLVSINLPDGINEFGTGVFNDCSALKTVNIPAGVSILSDELFLNTAIESIEIPAAITIIGAYALANNSLTRVIMNSRDVRTLTYDVTSFGDVAKANLEVPAGGKVVYQEYYPWMDFKTISEYGEDTGEKLVPDQHHVIIDGIRYLLKDGKAIVSIQPITLEGDINIPATVSYEGTDYPVTAIQDCYWSYGSHMNDERGAYHQSYRGAFTDTKVTSVRLPESLTTIGEFAFFRAESLKKVELPDGLITLGDWVFAHCSQLTDINIPTSITNLPYGALAYCTGLKSLTISEGVTTIGMECLIGSGIETLSIPSTCQQLGYQSLELPMLKVLYLNVKEPSDLRASNYGGELAMMNGTVFGHDNEQEAMLERISKADLVVPLGCAESYKVLAPWFNFRSVTDVGSPYLKLNGNEFAAPEGSFIVEDESPVYEDHSGWYVENYTKGLAIDYDTKIKFTTTAPESWVYIYLFSCNTSKVKMDGTAVTTIGEDQSTSSYTFYRYDVLVDAGQHVVTCDDYQGNQVPCMFLLRVQDTSGEYYQPEKIGVNINGVNYVLEETMIEGQEEPVRTATIARQKTSLSGDIVIPAKVSYANTVLQGNEWVTLEAHDYDVTEIVAAGFEIREAPGIFRTTDGAFQECQINSISLPTTITIIPAGTFNGCPQLKTVTLAEGITTIGGGAFANCTSLEDIYLPETITDMSDWYVFGNCPSLKKVNIPKQVTTIGNGCFMRSGIETFIIPKSVTSIGEACFGETNLKNIKICHESYSDGSISFPEDIFDDVSGITLIVPESKKESLYSQVYPWKNFGTIIEYTDQNDEHLYNSYRVEYEEDVEEEGETPAEGRSRQKKTKAVDEPVTAGFTPSGVAPELPTEIEKNGRKYTVMFKDIPTTVMPGKDLVLKVILTQVGTKGDINGDGKVNAADIVMVVNFIMDHESGQLDKSFDVNDDGVVDAADIVTIVNKVMGK